MNRKSKLIIVLTKICIKTINFSNDHGRKQCCLTQAASLTLGLEESEDVTWTFISIKHSFHVILKYISNKQWLLK